jgi:hypothetical protein
VTGTRLVDASAVSVGDQVVFLGRAHLVQSVEDYTHPAFPGQAWRIAREDATGWSITLIPGQLLEVLR